MTEVPEYFLTPTPREKLLRTLDRRDKAFRVFEVVVLGLVVVVTMFSLFRLNQIAASNQASIMAHTTQVDDVAGANKARLDVGLCIVSVPPQTRTPEYVHACYDNAEKTDGIKIQRFGYGQ